MLTSPAGAAAETAGAEAEPAAGAAFAAETGAAAAEQAEEAAPEREVAAAGRLRRARARRKGQPDLNGIWQTLNAASWDIRPHNAQDGVPAGLGVVEGGEIPYQPWAAAQQQQNYANRLTDDPVRKCYLPGVPRITYMPFPFRILQTPDHVVITYEYAARGAHHLYRRQSRIRCPTTSGWGTRAATGTATRWWSTPPTSTA